MLNLNKRANSRKQGDIGLAVAILWFKQQGHDVYLPLTDSQDADMIADINGKASKIQVRTTYHKTEHGIYRVHLRVMGGNRSGTGKVKLFDPSSVDYLFAVTENGDKYLIPSHVIEASNFLNLGHKYQLYKVV